jgi:hypothetical protein
VGNDPIPHPVLRLAHGRVAQRPRRVQKLLVRIGGGLWIPLADLLVERGLIRRERSRSLFPKSRFPAADTRRKTGLRQKIRAVLEDGESPDARTAAMIALISASGTLPNLHPTPTGSSQVHTRAKELETGHWGTDAVNTAVTRTAAAIAASSAAAVATTIT